MIFGETIFPHFRQVPVNMNVYVFLIASTPPPSTKRDKDDSE